MNIYGWWYIFVDVFSEAQPWGARWCKPGLSRECWWSPDLQSLDQKAVPSPSLGTVLICHVLSCARESFCPVAIEAGQPHRRSEIAMCATCMGCMSLTWGRPQRALSRNLRNESKYTVNWVFGWGSWDRGWQRLALAKSFWSRQHLDGILECL